MKKLIIIVILSNIVSSCTTYKREKFDYHFGSNEWINIYKTNVFFACIRNGYGNDTIFKLIGKTDLLFPIEAVYDEIENNNVLGKQIIINMPKPVYPHCDECNEEEEAKKNYICASCLNYYASRELDSISKEAYINHVKMKKKHR